MKTIYPYAHITSVSYFDNNFDHPNFITQDRCFDMINFWFEPNESIHGANEYTVAVWKIKWKYDDRVCVKLVFKQAQTLS